MTFIPRLL